MLYATQKRTRPPPPLPTPHTRFDSIALRAHLQIVPVYRKNDKIPHFDLFPSHMICYWTFEHFRWKQTILIETILVINIIAFFPKRNLINSLFWIFLEPITNVKGRNEFGVARKKKEKDRLKILEPIWTKEKSTQEINLFK